MSNNKNNVVSAPIKPAMTVTPESVSAIASVAAPSPQSEEAAQAARLAATKAAEQDALEKRIAKQVKRQKELDESPIFRLCGQAVKNVALERAIQAVDRESGRIRKDAKESGLLSIKEAADGKTALIYDSKCVREMVKLGYASKADGKDVDQMKRLIGALVHFGVMVRPETFEDDEE
jgi:hypothetical protein